ncbi:low-density lipoprotein receptor-like isoform X2 [Eriocheir sinensis]|uniref:low-density lipoprotein receptor-like isoform X2 n=1 Tax=Eriocheir sinensis TaxID=95602 RepID=UPI0021C730B3|nr:low-density lipoprotein receptor-like isoform X2 [Eriocheir sinensis]
MTRVVQCVVWVLLLSLSSCTDLAAVYKHDILILRDADLIIPNSPLSWESLSLALPRPLSYPVGLTQDSLNNRLFVAEAKPKEEGKILSLTLNAQLEVVDMTPAVQSGLVSVIEGMSYSPKTGHLYWTDASVQYIYKATVPNELGDIVSKPEVIHHLGSRNEPRGLAVDPCKELLYWSEKGGGVVPSSVEMWNPGDNKHHVIQEDKGKNDFYQGLSFDAATRNLLWAVTEGDELNSTCRIVKTSVDKMHDEELISLENCYPFSLTSDEKYIYWADWGRQGIMRASLTDPSDIVKLVHTPRITSEEEEHFGVYGLAKLIRENSANENSCKGKDELQSHEDKMLQDPAENPHQEAEDKTKGSSELKGVLDVSSNNPESTKEGQDGQDPEAEGPKKNPGADETKVNDGKDTELVEDAGSSENSEEGEVEEVNSHKDRIVMSLKKLTLLAQADVLSAKTKEEAKSKSVEAVTEVYNDKTQTDMFASHSTYELPTTEGFSRCHEDQLLKAVLILTAISALFLGSTIILAIMLYRRKRIPFKGASAAILEAPQAVPVQPPRQVKRFGPKKSVVSGNKSGHSGSATCSGLANDGVSINIEDCCQMTLCETPCYTTVKKQGKSYKDIRKNTCDDKRGLLDDSEEV